jgi:hypothetical protein
MAKALAFLAVLVLALPAWSAEYNVTATGRCVYQEGGQTYGIPGAKVELRDQNFWMPPAVDIVGPTALDFSVNTVCARGTTDANGYFRLSGRCGDLGPSWLDWTKPDLYVRCSLESGAAKVINSQFPFTLYNTATNPRSNNASPLHVGDVVLPAGPAKVFLHMNQSYTKVSPLAGTSFLPVWAVWPGGHEAVIANSGQHYFASYSAGVFISIARGQEGLPTVSHEWGHSLHFQSFLNDWGRIDALLNVLRAGWALVTNPIGGGHNVGMVSNPSFAFAEGWAEFHANVVAGPANASPNCDKWTEKGSTEEERLKIEGNIACRLYRLYLKWGYRDIWQAQTRAKAVQYAHFMQEYLKIHPDAEAVANPSATVRRVASLAAPPAVPRRAVAATPVSTVAQAPAPRAVHFAQQARLTPRVSQSVAAAEGASCAAVRDAYRLKMEHLAQACARVKDAGRKALCLQLWDKTKRRAEALHRFCPASK